MKDNANEVAFNYLQELLQDYPDCLEEARELRNLKDQHKRTMTSIHTNGVCRIVKLLKKAMAEEVKKAAINAIKDLSFADDE